MTGTIVPLLFLTHHWMICFLLQTAEKQKMNTISIKRPSFLSSNYSVSVNGQNAYAAKVKFTLKDPQEITLQPTSGRVGDTITMKPVAGKTGYGDKAEYSLHKGGAEAFGYFLIEGRVCPTIRLLDSKRSDLGVIQEKSKLYSMVRTLLQKILPNFYACKNNNSVIFTATEIYTPIMCRVKLKLNSNAPMAMDDHAICAGLWIACTPSF